MIYNPVLEEMYTGRRGHGAFCNGQRLQATKTEGKITLSVSTPVVACELYSTVLLKNLLYTL